MPASSVNRWEAFLTGFTHSRLTTILLHVAFWLCMFRWIMFQSHWIAGDIHPRANWTITIARYTIVVLTFYLLSVGTRLKGSTPAVVAWIVGLLVASLIVYCLDMYYVLRFINGLFPDMPPYFKRLYANISANGPWTFLRVPEILYFHFEQFGLALLPALVIKVFRLTLQARLKTLKLEKSNLELELNFLRTQINPHFLFNTLNSVYSLVEDKDQVAASIIHSLSNMMRYALYDSNAVEVEAIKELEFIRGYLEIQNIRHSNRMQVDLKISPEAYHQRVPPLILVTFLENAVKHGVDKMIKKSYIKIESYKDKDDRFCFYIANSRPPKARSGTVGGIGIKNTTRRLDILYPNRHSLDIHETEEEYSVLLKIW